MRCRANFSLFDEKYYLFCIKSDENVLSDHDNYTMNMMQTKPRMTITLSPKSYTLHLVKSFIGSSHPITQISQSEGLRELISYWMLFWFGLVRKMIYFGIIQYQCIVIYIYVFVSMYLFIYLQTYKLKSKYQFNYVNPIYQLNEYVLGGVCVYIF